MMGDYSALFRQGDRLRCFFGTREPGRPEDLYEEERGSVRNAVLRRAAEFAAGRRCARQALLRLGLPGCAIPMGSDRAPVWPAGVAGSISHTDGFACAYVSSGPGSLGVDVERLDRELQDAAWAWILTPAERARLAGAAERLLAFSAKESFFKAAFRKVGGYFGFESVEVSLAGNGRAFALRTTRELAEDLQPGIRFVGRCRVRPPFVLTALELA